MAEYWALVALQMSLNMLLQPPDGGRLFAYSTCSLATFDAVVYFLFVSPGRGARPSWRAMLTTFLVGSAATWILTAAVATHWG
ncbi:MAG: hypothetical protein U0939_24335 [Pirellulales bacterium]